MRIRDFVLKVLGKKGQRKVKMRGKEEDEENLK